MDRSNSGMTIVGNVLFLGNDPPRLTEPSGMVSLVALVEATTLRLDRIINSSEHLSCASDADNRRTITLLLPTRSERETEQTLVTLFLLSISYSVDAGTRLGN